MPSRDDGAQPPTHDLRALLGAGELSAGQQLFLSTDWAATPIGAPTTWSTVLQAAISTAMNTRFGMLVMAGPELVMVYNDAYAPFMGALHPAMGRPLAQVWADEWPTLRPMIEAVLTDREANFFTDFPLLTSRNGFPEEAWFTYSYSPLIDPRGGVVGLLNTVIETTDRVLATRRLELAQHLAQLGTTRHAGLGEAAAAVTAVLAEHRADLPFAGVYLLEDPEDTASALAFRAGHGIPSSTAPFGYAHAQLWLRAALGGAAQTVSDIDGTWEPVVTPGESGSGAAHTAVVLPLTPPGRATPVGVLVLGLSPHLRRDQDYRTFQELVANQVAGVLGDTLAHLTELAASAASRSMSEALQRSLLTEPVRDSHLQIVNRYRPAVLEAEIGGDWYDSFQCQDGATWLVVGDVAGHDQTAAATMAQVRNLLRGIAYTLHQSPAEVLTALDAAMTGLGVGRLTSVVAMRIERGPDRAVDGVRRVQWSNAGHPAPLVVRADGEVRALLAPAERILGAEPGSSRSDHEMVLHPGDGLLLYTDGLIERRGTDLDDGRAWLVERVAASRHQPLDDLCDELLSAVTEQAEDDIALLALRAHREDRRGREEAGPPGRQGGLPPT
ncbi:MAG: serine/threonine-protein phosphatase [Klenkia sp.]|nr:serine/threonine-protein phosphatase [Klenkia sp.]